MQSLVVRKDVDNKFALGGIGRFLVSKQLRNKIIQTCASLAKNDSVNGDFAAVIYLDQYLDRQQDRFLRFHLNRKHKGKVRFLRNERCRHHKVDEQKKHHINQGSDL